jgi:hypothetical protein
MAAQATGAAEAMWVAECTVAVDGAITATSAEEFPAVATPITMEAAGRVAETAFTEVAAVSMAVEAPTAADDAKPELGR